MEDITSAKFRIFLAEKAIDYLYIANAGANILLSNTNIGCPNISFGPSTFPCPPHPTFPVLLVPSHNPRQPPTHSPVVRYGLIVDCELYEYMASRTLSKIIQFFEEGQSSILAETVLDEPPEGEDELDQLGNWEDLREKMVTGDMEKLLEVGIGAGQDDSEWFRVK